MLGLTHMRLVEELPFLHLWLATLNLGTVQHSRGRQVWMWAPDTETTADDLAG